MKVRSREVNVFSMSALDLFASAMGAFMFLAIIALPFFPNTGDSAERVADIKSELKKAEAQIAEEQKQKAEIAKQRDEVQKKLDEEQSTSKISFPTMDMVIALDTTASMDKQVKGLRAEIVDIANLLMKLSPDAALGVIDFKDRCEPRGQ
jgi:predicted transcriptional regulator